MDGGNADRKANFTLAERVYKQDFDIFMIQFSHRTDFNDLLLSKRGNNERKQNNNQNILLNDNDNIFLTRILV